MADSRTTGPFSVTGLLQRSARLFGFLVRLRDTCYRKGVFNVHRLPCVVISIGNITFGGTGKTPATLYVANLLQRLGYRVAILSRGYKGGSEKKGGIVSDGKRLLMPPESAGDEPFMMARFLENVPVLVGQNRVASGRLAISRFSPDILLLDDGFQHRRLHRDMDIVLLDSSRPFGNRFMIPRGSLREPPDALKRAHAIIFTRCYSGLSEQTSLLPEAVQDRPIFRSRNVPYIHSRLPSATESTHPPETPDVTCLKDARVFAFSAIANNKDFHRVLAELGSRTVGSEEFPDHHAYTALELEDIGHKAKAMNAEYLVTTQKDLSKLPPDTPWPLPLVILGVLPSFIGEKNDFDDFLKTAIKKAIDRRSTLN